MIQDGGYLERGTTAGNFERRCPARYDIDWWRGYWKRTQVQAVIISAGGLVAYYPSKFPLPPAHHTCTLVGR